MSVPDRRRPNYSQNTGSSQPHMHPQMQYPQPQRAASTLLTDHTRHNLSAKSSNHSDISSHTSDSDSSESTGSRRSRYSAEASRMASRDPARPALSTDRSLTLHHDRAREIAVTVTRPAEIDTWQEYRRSDYPRLPPPVRSCERSQQYRQTSRPRSEVRSQSLPANRGRSDSRSRSRRSSRLEERESDDGSILCNVAMTAAAALGFCASTS